MNLIQTFDHKLYDAGQQAIKIVNGATAEMKKLATIATTDLPIIEGVLTNPIIAAIASDFPGGTADLAALTTLLNKFQSALVKAIDNDVITALQTHLIAEITSLIHGAQLSFGDYLVKIIKMIGL